MKYCQMCGKEIMDEAVICPGCGCRTQYDQDAGNDAPDAGIAVLSFFFPIVGLILYLIWMDKTPLKAKSAGKGALIGVIIGVAIAVIVSVINAVTIASFLF